VRRGLIAAVAALALAVPAAASAQEFAPLDRPGPPLSVPQSDLDASLNCTAGLASATRPPVLLSPGTTVTPEEEFSWSWEPALTKLGIPWCAVTVPGHTMADIQVAGEYIAGAIRYMHRVSGQKVSIIGHSQGGMSPRWALRFWPDTRGMVDDLIGLAPSNHGTIDADGICLVGGCAPAIWQQRSSSEFGKALNSGAETFAGVSYTSVYSHLDEVVVPNFDDSGSSSLHTGDGAITNVASQDICPLNLADHLLLGITDPVAYALAVDALDHPGPADPARISPSVCAQLLQPGVDPLTFPTNFVAAAVALAETLALYPHVAAEPPLACYTLAECPSSQSGEPGGAAAPARHRSKKRKRCKTGTKKKRRACARKHRRRH
jgi:putative serine esterase DUF676